jgi:hypothetical protein
VALGAQVKRLGKHTAVYGIGGLVSRILASSSCRCYTQLPRPEGFGKIETIVALTTVLVIVPADGDLERVSSASTSTRRTRRTGRSSSAPRSGSR